jgi:hypothetical protein
MAWYLIGYGKARKRGVNGTLAMYLAMHLALAFPWRTIGREIAGK